MTCCGQHLPDTNMLDEQNLARAVEYPCSAGVLILLCFRDYLLTGVMNQVLM